MEGNVRRDRDGSKSPKRPQHRPHFVSISLAGLRLSLSPIEGDIETATGLIFDYITIESNTKTIILSAILMIEGTCAIKEY